MIRRAGGLAFHWDTAGQPDTVFHLAWARMAALASHIAGIGSVEQAELTEIANLSKAALVFAAEPVARGGSYRRHFASGPRAVLHLLFLLQLEGGR
jgi:hypothetical protein